MDFFVQLLTVTILSQPSLIVHQNYGAVFTQSALLLGISEKPNPAGQVDVMVKVEKLALFDFFVLAVRYPAYLATRNGNVSSPVSVMRLSRHYSTRHPT